MERGALDTQRLRDPARLNAVALTGLIDTPATPAFDELAALASRLLDMPLAFTTFVDTERSYWKAAVGTGIDAEDVVSRANRVEESFCQYVIMADGPVVVADASLDPLTKDNPSVTSMGVRAWAGYPVRSTDGHILGSFCVVDTKPREFTVRDLELLAALTGTAQREVYLHQALREATQAASTVLEQTTRTTRLATASDRLSDSLDARQVITALSEIVVPELGDWLAVALLGGVANEELGIATSGDPDNARVVAVTHREPRTEAAFLKAVMMLPLSSEDSRGIGRVIASSAPHFEPAGAGPPSLAYAPDALDEVWPLIAADSTLSVPLISRGRTLGGLTVGNPGADEADHALLGQLALRAATALDNALTYAATQRAVVDLQRSLMPMQPPSLPGVEVAARYLPATRGALVGGDFHQVVISGDRLILVLGDIEGHGMASAARMGQLRAAVATLALEGHDPAVLLTRLTAQADQILDLNLATVLLARFDTVSRELVVASAGHPPVVVWEPDGPAVLGAVDPGPPLGVGPHGYVQSVQTLSAGSLLVLYSDGLVERRGQHLDVGLETLRAAVSGAAPDGDPESICDAVLAAMQSADSGQDDVALLVVRA